MGSSVTEIAAARDADSRTWIGPVFACLFIFSIAKGIRMPNRWAMTHALATFSIGLDFLWDAIRHPDRAKWIPLH